MSIDDNLIPIEICKGMGHGLVVMYNGMMPGDHAGEELHLYTCMGPPGPRSRQCGSTFPDAYPPPGREFVGTWKVRGMDGKEELKAFYRKVHDKPSVR